MRAGLAREVVREETAYRVGRSVVDIALALQWLGTVILLVLFFKGHYEFPGSQAELALASVVVGSAVVGSILALVFRELAHAVFDMADRALTGGKELFPGQNPFKQ